MFCFPPQIKDESWLFLISFLLVIYLHKLTEDGSGQFEKILVFRSDFNHYNRKITFSIVEEMYAENISSYSIFYILSNY